MKQSIQQGQTGGEKYRDEGKIDSRKRMFMRKGKGKNGEKLGYVDRPDEFGLQK